MTLATPHEFRVLDRDGASHEFVLVPREVPGRARELGVTESWVYFRGPIPAVTLDAGDKFYTAHAMVTDQSEPDRLIVVSIHGRPRSTAQAAMDDLRAALLRFNVGADELLNGAPL